jgi:hypothetical protein
LIGFTKLFNISPIIYDLFILSTFSLIISLAKAHFIEQCEIAISMFEGYCHKTLAAMTKNTMSDSYMHQIAKICRLKIERDLNKFCLEDGKLFFI